MEQTGDAQREVVSGNAPPPPPHGLRLAFSQQSAAAALAFVAVVWITSAQGGFFPTSWGWSTVAPAGVICTWAAVSGRTDFGRADLAFSAALILLSGWTAASHIWSNNPAQTMAELERSLVPLTGCVAFLAIARKREFQAGVFALLLGISAISVYSLATRLVPDRFGVYDPVATYRLSAPIGYWNGLGIFTAMGILLAFGVAAEANLALFPRMVGAVAMVPLSVALLFTYSRGSWIALGLGAVALVGASPSRVRLLTLGPVLAAAPAIGVIIAAGSPALTHQHASAAADAHDGHRLVVMLLVVAAMATLILSALAWLEARVQLRPEWSKAFGVVLSVLGAALLIALLVRAGGPVDLAKRSYQSFSAAAPAGEKIDLNHRLLSLNGNGRAQLWRVAFDATKGHWLTGTGAGSFIRNWERNPRANFTVRDAHGLYIETLSELGLVGLAFLVAALLTPLLVGISARKTLLVPAAIAAYVAFIFHNGIDWDWELSGVGLTGLLIGSLLLVSNRSGSERVLGFPTRALTLLATLTVALIAVIGGIGNAALARARSANQQQRYQLAASNAVLARRWMPWATDPLLALGEAQLETGDASGATRSFRKAIAVDRGDWQAWLDLAASTQGETRARAVAKARALYPTSPEVTQFEQDLADAGATR
jgi:O-Antigen ligase